MRNNKNIFWTPLTLLALMAVACQPSSKVTTNTSPASSSAIAPANMARVGTIDDRYQSYNVEMLEVTGGKFWKPYGPELDAIVRQPSPTTAQAGTQSGGDRNYR